MKANWPALGHIRTVPAMPPKARTKRPDSKKDDPAMLTREEVRGLALEAKDALGLTWPKVGEAIGRAPVYAALLVYGYGQATAEEATGLAKTLALPEEAKAAM